MIKLKLNTKVPKRAMADKNKLGLQREKQNKTRLGIFNFFCKKLVNG